MYTIYAKDGSEQAQLRTPLGAVEVVNILTSMRPDEADPPTTAEEQAALLVRDGRWAAGCGYTVLKAAEVGDMKARMHEDGTLEMIIATEGDEQRLVSRDKGETWNGLPPHSALLRQLADRLEGIPAADVLRAGVAGQRRPVLEVQLACEAFLLKFGPASAQVQDAYIHYSATHDGVEWTACRPMTATERADLAALKAVS